MNNKDRLLELISKRNEMCSQPLNYELVCDWLKEINYLLGELNFSSTLIPKIRREINQIFFFDKDPRILKANLTYIKARLFVFEKYEIEKLKKI